MVLMELGKLGGLVPSAAFAWSLLKIKSFKIIRTDVENFKISGRVIHIRDCRETFEESLFPNGDNSFSGIG